MAVFSDHPLAIDDLSSKELLSRESENENEPDERTDHVKEKATTTFCQWLFQKPLSKLPFIYFVLSIIGVFGLSELHFIEPDTSYIICGFYYIGLCLYAIKYFRALNNLKQKVETFDSLNQKLLSEHNKLSFQVKRLTDANKSLRDSSDRIQAANAKNRENLIQFTLIQETMKSLDVAEVNELVTKSNFFGDRWKEQLIERERDMLHTVFNRYELASGKDGMTREDFQEFSLQLPSSYQQRFGRLGTFRQVSADGETVKFSDFDVALDTFAEMEALDVDIDFSIQKQNSTTNDDKIVPPMIHARGKSTLEIMQISSNKTDDFGDISDMKQWKTQRKVYDEFDRKVVVHSKTAPSRKLKDFTASLGLWDDESDNEEQS